MKNKEIISKMLQIVEKIETYCANMDYNCFAATPMCLEACVFNLSQLGEAVGKLDENFISQHPRLPWRQMKGLRNKIVHDYDGVNPVLVWEIIQNDLPVLKEDLEKII
ncbi:MAG: DUF86 domain-containing protein [Clostridia bacterium]|nr:DUF86 domain-containing protein [Clostridia bacterium]